MATSPEHLDDTLLIGKQLPWKLIEGQILRILHFTPFAAVEGDRVKVSSGAVPYAVLTVECPALNLRAMMPVGHRLDFRSLWEIYEERGVVGEEEVLLGYTPYRGLLGPLLRPFFPRLHLRIYPKGALEFFGDPKGRPPPLIAEWRPSWWR